MSRVQSAANEERTVRVQNGWVMLVLLLGSLVADIALLIAMDASLKPVFALLIPPIGLLMAGFFTLQPNEARVVLLFGAYKGTVRDSGFHWGNPFYSNGPQQLGSQLAAMQSKSMGAKGESRPAGQRTLGRNKISLRARTLNGEKLKVNDKR